MILCVFCFRGDTGQRVGLQEGYGLVAWRLNGETEYKSCVRLYCISRPADHL